MSFVFAALLAVQSLLPSASFDAIELSGGGEVVVRHGSAHRITLLEGDRGISRIGVTGNRLVVAACPARCPRGYRLRLEVEVPALTALSVENGGSVEIGGAFPAQAELAAAVRNGGAIDVRALDAAEVNAAIGSGGMILTRPRRSLRAAIADGGMVTYWGSPAVRSSVQRGGVVARGAAGDLQRPLQGFAAGLAPVPPLPLLPPAPGS